jgi:hypothetical protein
MDDTASEKMTRFIDFCDTLHLPMLSFEDELVGQLHHSLHLQRRAWHSPQR